MTYQFFNHARDFKSVAVSPHGRWQRLLQATLGACRLLVFLAAGLSLSINQALAESKNIVVRPGGECHCYTFYRVDGNGKPWRVTLKVTEKPKNGTLSITTRNEVRNVNGKSVTVPVTRQTYKAKPGFYGSDSFKFVLVVGDPTDRRNGQEYSVAVTVR